MGRESVRAGTLGHRFTRLLLFYDPTKCRSYVRSAGPHLHTSQQSIVKGKTRIVRYRYDRVANDRAATFRSRIDSRIDRFLEKTRMKSSSEPIDSIRFQVATPTAFTNFKVVSCSCNSRQSTTHGSKMHAYAVFTVAAVNLLHASASSFPPRAAGHQAAEDCAQPLAISSRANDTKVRTKEVRRTRFRWFSPF